MAIMHNPPHPGEVLRDGMFCDTGITVTEFAKRLGITRVALSRVLNGKAAVSADMAVRLAAALGGSAESWLHMQVSYDLWRSRKALRGQVARIRPIAAVHAGAQQKMRAGIVGLAKQFINIASTITSVDVARRIVQQRGGLPQIVHPLRICRILDWT